MISCRRVWHMHCSAPCLSVMTWCVHSRKKSHRKDFLQFKQRYVKIARIVAIITHMNQTYWHMWQNATYNNFCTRLCWILFLWFVVKHGFRSEIFYFLQKLLFVSKVRHRRHCRQKTCHPSIYMIIIFLQR